MTSRELRVGIAGCGQIAEAHLGGPRHQTGAGAVAVCDVEPLFAEDMADHFEITAWYGDYV